MKREMVAVGIGAEALGRPAVVSPGGRSGAGAPQRSGGERSEPERSEGAPAASPTLDVETGVVEMPDPEVSSGPARRRLTVAFKLEILRKADACVERGDIGALLRREGLYSSQLVTWRRQRDQGVLTALAPQKRGRKAEPVNPLARKLAEVERENRRLVRQLQKADAIILFQKKVAELLGIPLNRSDDAGTD